MGETPIQTGEAMATSYLLATAHLHGGSEGECSGHYGLCPPALNSLGCTMQESTS